MPIPVSPELQLAFAAALFLVGFAILGVWPNRWRLALAVMVPSSVLTIWLVFAPELMELYTSLFTPQ